MNPVVEGVIGEDMQRFKAIAIQTAAGKAGRGAPAPAAAAAASSTRAAAAGSSAKKDAH